MNDEAARRKYIARQIVHWTDAAARLERLDDLASQASWQALEQYLGVSIRRCLTEAVARLEQQGAALHAALTNAVGWPELEAVWRKLLAFRHHYLQVEITLAFYANAINTRSSPELGALLRACDALAYRSLRHALDCLDKPSPLVLTYIDTGLGAQVLKARLRLWDRDTISPAAAVKIVRHHLKDPTSLIHETGHQFAHEVKWNEELSQAIKLSLPPEVAGIWAHWTSEISADAFAFAHTGYAAVDGLHVVLASEEDTVFRILPDDPHPIGYLRVLFGVEMCRQFYGAGPWDELAAQWTDLYPVHDAPEDVQRLIQASLPALPAVVELCLRTPMQAFGGRRLADLVNPERVRPDTLEQLETQLGPALYTSLHWVWTESLRLLALSGYREATGQARDQHRWMLRLGSSLQAA